jgi:hypothetical protein
MQPSLPSSHDRFVQSVQFPIQFAAFIEPAVRRQAVEVFLLTVRARNIDERLAPQPLAVRQRQQFCPISGFSQPCQCGDVVLRMRLLPSCHATFCGFSDSRHGEAPVHRTGASLLPIDLAVQLAGHDFLKSIDVTLIPATAPDFFC